MWHHKIATLSMWRHENATLDVRVACNSGQRHATLDTHLKCKDMSQYFVLLRCIETYTIPILVHIKVTAQKEFFVLFLIFGPNATRDNM